MFIFIDLSVKWNRNPLYLMVLFVAFLLSKALWVQMDIAGEFRNGTVSMITVVVHSFLLS